MAGDLIDRKAAIDAIQEEIELFLAIKPNSSKIVGPGVRCEDVIKILRRLPSAQPEQRWILVTERLPDELVSVQAHMTDAGPFPSTREAYRVDGEWFFPALNERHPVDKWAEFFEPPKEEPSGNSEKLEE